MKRHREEWHTLIWHALKQSNVAKPLNTPITVSSTQFSSRQRDIDNTIMSVKFLLDTLKEHGYIKDDSPQYVSKVILQSRKAKKNKLVIILQEYAKV